MCVSLRNLQSIGFMDGTIGKDRRFQATRRVEITRGTCKKKEKEKSFSRLPISHNKN